MSLKAFDESIGSSSNQFLKNLKISPIKSFSSATLFACDGLTPRELVGCGAVREDDAPRPLNHFYNPINGGALSLDGLSIPGNLPSPDWALEDSFSTSSQEFSYQDAMGYFYKALTMSYEADRDQQLGMLFLALGHVIHHIQDMAQSQHVRDDQHLDLATGTTIAACIFPQLCAAYLAIRDPSLYERYTREKLRTAAATMRNLLTGYSPVYPLRSDIFNKPRKFWATGKGQGLAEYTNRNFVSKDTNFKNPGEFGFFEEPLQIGPPQPCVSIGALLGAGTSLGGCVQFISTLVRDYGSDPPTLTTNDKASTLSLFDDELESRGFLPVYTLNRFNFDAAHEFLIKRAVGYSAGLLNYFSRGNIDLIPNSSAPGSFSVKNLGTEHMTGTFGLYYDDRTAQRRLLQSWHLDVAPAGGMSTPLNLIQPTTPPPATPGEYVLVFNGVMGDSASSRTLKTVTGKVVQLETKSLLVTKNGLGTGSVSTSPPGIQCGEICTFAFLAARTVRLTAIPGAGSAFVSWGSDCAGTGLNTSVIMSKNKVCNANFRRLSPKHSITIDIEGPGKVSYDSIDGVKGVCEKHCVLRIEHLEAIFLTAQATSGAKFDGWGGNGCGSSINPNCSFVVDTDKGVTARFGAPSSFLTIVSKGGAVGIAGLGASGGSHLLCGTSCNVNVDDGRGGQSTKILFPLGGHSGLLFFDYEGTCPVLERYDGGNTVYQYACVVVNGGGKTVVAVFGEESGVITSAECHYTGRKGLRPDGIAEEVVATLHGTAIGGQGSTIPIFQETRDIEGRSYYSTRSCGGWGGDCRRGGNEPRSTNFTVTYNQWPAEWQRPYSDIPHIRHSPHGTLGPRFTCR